MYTVMNHHLLFCDSSRLIRPLLYFAHIYQYVYIVAARRAVYNEPTQRTRIILLILRIIIVIHQPASQMKMKINLHLSNLQRKCPFVQIVAFLLLIIFFLFLFRPFGVIISYIRENVICVKEKKILQKWKITLFGFDIEKRKIRITYISQRPFPSRKLIFKSIFRVHKINKFSHGY